MKDLIKGTPQLRAILAPNGRHARSNFGTRWVSCPHVGTPKPLDTCPFAGDTNLQPSWHSTDTCRSLGTHQRQAFLAFCSAWKDECWGLSNPRPTIGSLPKPLSAHNANFTFLSRTVFNMPFSISALASSRFNSPEFPQDQLFVQKVETRDNCAHFREEPERPARPSTLTTCRTMHPGKMDRLPKASVSWSSASASQRGGVTTVFSTAQSALDTYVETLHPSKIDRLPKKKKSHGDLTLTHSDSSPGNFCRSPATIQTSGMQSIASPAQRLKTATLLGHSPFSHLATFITHSKTDTCQQTSHLQDAAAIWPSASHPTTSR